MKEVLGEWSDTLQAFWFGANGAEHIAFKGSSDVFVYDCLEESWAPPVALYNHNKRIEDLEEFTNAINTGRYLILNYKEVRPRG